MKFLKYLTEEFIKSVVIKNRRFEIYKNPTTSEVKNLRKEIFKDFGDYECRYIVDDYDTESCDLYVFPSNLLHWDAIKALKVPAVHHQRGHILIQRYGILKPNGKIEDEYRDWTDRPWAKYFEKGKYAR